MPPKPLEEVVCVVPIMGRKFVRVDFRGANIFGGQVGPDQTVRITGTWAHTQPTGPSSGFARNDNFEVELVPPTVVLQGESKEFVIDTIHPGISYLLIKGKPDFALGTAQVTVHAFD
jgi:hypothetical protein